MEATHKTIGGQSALGDDGFPTQYLSGWDMQQFKHLQFPKKES
jgi:hypothetical protein